MQKPLNRIVINSVTDAVEIYFDTNLYDVDQKEIAAISAASQMAGKTTDFDLNRLQYGKIVCHFNPASMTLFRAMETVKELVDYIQYCSCA